MRIFNKNLLLVYILKVGGYINNIIFIIYKSYCLFKSICLFIINYLFINIKRILLKDITKTYIYKYKNNTWWGIIPVFFIKVMSDNIHYVNLKGFLKKNNRKWGITFVCLLKVLDLLCPSQITPKIIKSIFSSSTMCRRSNGVVIQKIAMLVCKPCNGAGSFGVSAIMVPGGHGSQKNRHAKSKTIKRSYSW